GRPLAEHGPGGRHGHGAAVEGTHLLVVAVRDVLHHLLRPADGGAGDPPAAAPPLPLTAIPPPIDLARQVMSGIAPVSPVAPLGPAVRPVLTSSKVSSAPRECSRSLSAAR